MKTFNKAKINVLQYILIFFIISFIFIFLFWIPLIYINGLRPYKVVGSAMSPTYKDGAYVMGKIVDAKAPIERGDVVILTAPLDQKMPLIKRVIAFPKEKVKIQKGDVYINGKKLEEDYLPSKTETTLKSGYLIENETKRMPANHYFFLGDNRSKSFDSRDFGPIHRDQVQAVIYFCYYNCK